MLGGDGNTKSTKMRILQDRSQFSQTLCKSLFSKFQQYLRQFSFNMATVTFLWTFGFSIYDLSNTGKDFMLTLYTFFKADFRTLLYF
jgi:hypothetical protein